MTDTNENYSDNADLEEVLVICEGDEVSLAAIADIDMDDIEENRGPSPLPTGIYHLRVKTAELTSKEATDKKTKQKFLCSQAPISYEVLDVLDLEDTSIENPGKFIGQTHFETNMIQDQQRDVGRIKAQMVDSGFQGVGKFRERLTQYVGHELVARIKLTVSKDDPDMKFSNIDPKKIVPVSALSQAEEE